MTTTERIPDHIVAMVAGRGQVAHLFDLSAKSRIDPPLDRTPLAFCSAVRMHVCVVLTPDRSPRSCKRCLDYLDQNPLRLDPDSNPCRDDDQFRTPQPTIAELSAVVADLTERVQRYLDDRRDEDE